MTEAIYEQATGLFVILTPVPFRAVGYAGRGAGRNNPAMDMMRNVGPLPAGVYSVSLPYSHPRKGPMCFRLTPDASNEMFGRSGFLIHGDNAQGDASEGCIILGRAVRELIARHQVRKLHVVDMARWCLAHHHPDNGCAYCAMDAHEDEQRRAAA